MDHDLAVLASLLPIATPKNGGQIDLDDLVAATAFVSRIDASIRPSPGSTALNIIRRVLGANVVF